MTFEWFLLWAACCFAVAGIATPFILKAVDKYEARKLTELGQKEKDS
jgi:hypothetical protein